MRPIDTRQAPNGKNGFVVITKWQTAFGQTIYTKEFDDRRPTHQPDGQMQLEMQPSSNNSKPLQPTIQQSTVPDTQSTTVQQAVEKKQFRLDSRVIDLLLSKPEFKQNKTVGKAFKVIQALIEGKDTPETIAKQFDIDLAMVKLLKACMK